MKTTRDEALENLLQGLSETVNESICLDKAVDSMLESPTPQEMGNNMLQVITQQAALINKLILINQRMTIAVLEVEARLHEHLKAQIEATIKLARS